MRSLSLVLIFSGLVTAQRVVATPPPCLPALKRLLEAIYVPNQKLLKDAERGTSDPYWGRLSQAVHATPEVALQNLFVGKKAITQSDLEEIWWGVKSGVLPSDSATDRFIQGMRDFAREHDGLLDDKNVSVYRLLEALKQSDKVHGYSGAGNVASQATDKALAASEENLLVQALRESYGKRNQSNNSFDWFINFFSPHYKRMQELIRFNNELRAQMQHFYIADDPIEDALLKYATTLDNQGRDTLQALITDTNSHLAGVRKVIKVVYGSELSSIEPIQVGDLRLRKLATNLKLPAAKTDMEAVVKQAEHDMDQLDQVIAETRHKHDLGVRPMAEYRAAQLEIRHAQFHRETGSWKNYYYDYCAAKAKRSNYSVEAEWTVTVEHAEPKTRQVSHTVTDADGKTHTEWETEHYTDFYSTTYTMEDTFTLHGSYNEILDGQIRPSESEVNSQLPAAQTRGAWATSASNGSPSITDYDQRRVAEIMDAAKEVRANEKPLRQKIDQVIELTEKIREGYPANIDQEADWKKILASLDKAREDLVLRQTDLLEEYRKMPAQQIMNQWVNDTPEHFIERNKTLNIRYKHLIRRIEHFREQILRKVKNLEVTYQLREYKQQMDELERIHKRNRAITWSGGGVAVAGGAGAGYYYSDPQHRAELQAKWQRIKNYFGSSEKSQAPFSPTTPLVEPERYPPTTRPSPPKPQRRKPQRKPQSVELFEGIDVRGMLLPGIPVKWPLRG